MATNEGFFFVRYTGTDERYAPFKSAPGGYLALIYCSKDGLWRMRVQASPEPEALDINIEFGEEERKDWLIIRSAAENEIIAAHSSGELPSVPL